jgi:myo-inositol catabolism protein IolC
VENISDDDDEDSFVRTALNSESVIELSNYGHESGNEELNWPSIQAVNVGCHLKPADTSEIKSGRRRNNSSLVG